MADVYNDYVEATKNEEAFAIQIKNAKADPGYKRIMNFLRYETGSNYDDLDAHNRYGVDIVCEETAWGSYQTGISEDDWILRAYKLLIPIRFVVLSFLKKIVIEDVAKVEERTTSE